MSGEVGLLAIFLCPMVFGGFTFYYSHKAIHQETLDRWKRQGWIRKEKVECVCCNGTGRRYR